MATTQTSRTGWNVRPAPGVVREHVDHLQDPLGQFDLPDLERTLRSDEATSSEGHSAMTLVKHPDMRVVLVCFRAKGRMAQASTAARISLQALRGNVEVSLPGGTLDLPAGHLATLDGRTPFSVVALTESAVLLTLWWPGAGSGGQPTYPT